MISTAASANKPQIRNPSKNVIRRYRAPLVQLSEPLVRVCKDDKGIPNISKLNGFEESEAAGDDNTNRNQLVEEELILDRDNKLLYIIHLYRSTDELIKVKDVGVRYNYLRDKNLFFHHFFKQILSTMVT